MAGIVAMVAGVAGESVYWAKAHELPLESVTTRWAYKLGTPLPMPDLAEIPAGSFEMGEAGDQRTEPVHPVTFARPFHVAKTEVTFAQYDAFCEATARARPDAPYGRDDQPVGLRQLVRRPGVCRLAGRDDGQRLQAAERGRVGIRGTRWD
jgi:formylglycine-generating enzyme required for sulfatase activity